MIRKLAFATLAVSALGLTALAPSTAEAKHKHWHGHGHGHGHWHKHGHHHHHWGHRHFHVAPVYVGGCWVRRVVDTPYGPRLRRINVCY